MTTLRQIALSFATLTLTASLNAGEQFKIDDTHSIARFRVKHMGFSYTYGRFNKMSGSFTSDKASPEKGSIEITIEADSIDSNNQKRDQHLRGVDFFNTKRFPTMSFKSTKIEKTADKKFDVTGELTLHGVTKTVTVAVDQVGEGKDPWGGYRSGFETVFKINRSDYNMKHMLEGIGNEVTLNVTVEGIRK